MSSDLQFNKYAGAILATGLAILGLREASNILFEPDEAEKPGYAIAVPEALAGGGEEGPALPPDWGTVLPAANVASGATVSKKCASCHTFENGGPSGTGPNLWGVLGAAIAAKAGFAYSPALKEHAGKASSWTYDEMNGFLAAPARHVPGTKMTFVGLKNVDDRVNIIAYLRTMTSAPPAIPAPDPTRQPGAAPAAGPAVEGAVGTVPAPAGGATGTPPTATGGGMAGQTPTYGQPGAAPQAVTPSPGGEEGGRGSGSVSPGGGGQTTAAGTGAAATARPATNPQAQRPAAQPAPSTTRGARPQ